MNKKVLIILLIAFLLVFASLLLYNSSKQESTPDVPQDTDRGTDDIGIANPASVYCEDLGGEVEIRKLADGSERGFCLFDDQSECDEWEFFRGECERGAFFCKDLCGDGICQEVVCEAHGCPCAETPESCPYDCLPSKI